MSRSYYSIKEIKGFWIALFLEIIFIAAATVWIMGLTGMIGVSEPVDLTANIVMGVSGLIGVIFCIFCTKRHDGKPRRQANCYSHNCLITDGNSRFYRYSGTYSFWYKS